MPSRRRAFLSRDRALEVLESAPNVLELAESVGTFYVRSFCYQNTQLQQGGGKRERAKAHSGAAVLEEEVILAPGPQEQVLLHEAVLDVTTPSPNPPEPLHFLPLIPSVS